MLFFPELHRKCFQSRFVHELANNTYRRVSFLRLVFRYGQRFFVASLLRITGEWILHTHLNLIDILGSIMLARD